MTGPPGVERLEELRGELKDLIREAHGAVKDLRAAVRDAKQTIDTDLAAHMKAEVERQVGHLGAATEKAMRVAIAKVGREFDRLEAIFTGTDPQSRRAGQPPLEAMIQARRASTTTDVRLTREPPIPPRREP